MAVVAPPAAATAAAAAGTPASEGLDWKFSQVFGDKSPVDEVTDVDIVSAIEFDDTGEYIAAGDRGGRVVIFEKGKGGKKAAFPEYKFYCEFQSHEPEFDYLKSLEIEEKINKIKWCKRQNSSHLLLTTNDKTIKLWKVFEKKVKQVAVASNGITPDGGSGASASSSSSSSSSKLALPAVSTRETIVSAAPRRVFANAHAYHINSISLNSDGETYISSDDLRINLWNLGITNASFNIVDIKPPNMEELTEVITCADFHPSQCNIFMYSSSKGTIKLGDMRDSALCDQHAKVFEEEEDPANKSFFSEIISSISDIKFSRDGRYIVSRDYLTLKVWDVNMESKPVKVIPIHDHLRSKLCDLYENDCIFDKFECCLAGDGTYFLTGSYHNHFHLLDPQGKNHTLMEASKFSKTRARGDSTSSGVAGKAGKAKAGAKSVNPDTIDFSKKILHVAAHPREAIVAVAASNNLFIYHA